MKLYKSKCYNCGTTIDCYAHGRPEREPLRCLPCGEKAFRKKISFCVPQDELYRRATARADWHYRIGGDTTEYRRAVVYAESLLEV